MKRILSFFLVLCLAAAGTAVAGDAGGVSAGDVVLFGSYEQDNNPDNGPEEIEWIVLDVQNGKAMLLSKYILDAGKYNEETKAVTWDTCTLRTWLNSTFRDAAFSAEEQAELITTKVSAPKKETLSYGVDPGKDTADEVYLMSKSLCERYLCNAPELQAAGATAYAAQSLYTDRDGNARWMLRTPGRSNKSIAIIDEKGKVSDGSGVDSGCGIRPVIVVMAAHLDPEKVKPGEYTARMTAAAEAAAAEKQFRNDREALHELCSTSGRRGMETLAGEPVVTGKLAIGIDLVHNTEDSIDAMWYGYDFYGVPAEMLARTMAEADTIVLIYPEHTPVGSYSGPKYAATAYRTTTRVTVMDPKEYALYAPIDVAVNDPPKTATVSEYTLAVSGEMDVEAAIAKVMELYH